MRSTTRSSRIARYFAATVPAALILAGCSASPGPTSVTDAGIPDNVESAIAGRGEKDMRDGAQRADEEWHGTKGRHNRDDEPSDDHAAEAAGAGAGAGAASTEATADRMTETFDLQAHRGGRGENTEESREAFQHALDMGVTTLEFDIVLSKDGVPVVWHDPDIKAEKCADTEPVAKDDPQFPYVGKAVHDLTFEQLQTLNCNKALADFPDAQHTEDNRLLQLGEVLDMAKDHDVRFNIETKIEADDPAKSATPQEFVDAIVPELQERDLVERTTIQSFDWSSLPLVKKAEPKLDTVMLWSADTWTSGSPWTGKVDYDDVDGDIAKAAEKLDADMLSPEYSLVDAEMVNGAHEHNLPVMPWTANEPDDMNRLIDTGVDGVITDFPTALRDILNERGIDYSA